MQKMRQKVRFFNLKYSYVVGESIVVDVQYADGFTVTEQDWIAIFPAGFFGVAHFSALKMAPARHDFVNEDNNSTRSFYSNREYYKYQTLHYDQRSVIENAKNYTINEQLESFNAVYDAIRRQSEIHKIVFNANESKLLSRNFYQLAYVRQRTLISRIHRNSATSLVCAEYRSRHPEIIATSCVFYVEGGDGTPDTEICATISLDSFMATNETTMAKKSYNKRRKARRLTVRQNVNENSCTILRNIFCGLTNTSQKWKRISASSSNSSWALNEVCLTDEDELKNQDLDPDDEEETIFFNQKYSGETSCLLKSTNYGEKDSFDDEGYSTQESMIFTNNWKSSAGYRNQSSTNSKYNNQISSNGYCKQTLFKNYSNPQGTLLNRAPFLLPLTSSQEFSVGSHLSSPTSSASPTSAGSRLGSSLLSAGSDLTSAGSSSSKVGHQSLGALITRFFSDIFHANSPPVNRTQQEGPTSAGRSPNRQNLVRDPERGQTFSATQSMYEIGGSYVTPSYLRMDASTSGGEHSSASSHARAYLKWQTPPASQAQDYYQRLICQLTISNSNMARENELLTLRCRELDDRLKDHVRHLNSVYYTLFCNGYSALQFPDGEEVHLSQFHGALLHFLSSDQLAYGSGGGGGPKRRQSKIANCNEYTNLSEIASALKERQQREQHGEPRRHASSVSSNGTSSSSNASPSALSSVGGCAGLLSTSAASSTAAGGGAVGSENGSGGDAPPHAKLKTAMLKCITRATYDDMDEYVDWLVNRNAPSTSQSLRDDERLFFAAERVYHAKSRSLEDQMESSLRIRDANAPPSATVDAAARQQTARALSESELREFRYTKQIIPATGSLGAQSARTHKRKAARLRAQSVNGLRIGGLLFGASPALSSRHRTSASNAGAGAPRRSFAGMRSPILTLGRAPPSKPARNLI